MNARLVDRPAQLPAPVRRPCPNCGEIMTKALRYEATRTIPVWWCVDGCGHEEPPYRSSGRLIAVPLGLKPCAWCGERFEATSSAERACTPGCADALAAFTASGRRRASQ